MSPAKPRVLLVAPSFEILGGQAVQAAHVFRMMQQDPSVEMDFQPIPPPFPAVLRPLENLRFLRTVLRILLHTFHLLRRGWKYDILHVFSAAYTSYLFWTIPALLVAKLYGKKILLNYHDGQAEDHLRNWKMALPTIRMMDAVVAPTGYLVDIFKKFGIEIQTISNIIDMAPYHYRERAPLRPVFLHNRILEELYNVPCSLRAFKLVQDVYPGATLTVAHDGPSRPELEAYAKELGLRNTRFIGKVPHAQVAGMYDAADIYFTSPNIDCMPGSILECFASGLPVVATNAGGIPYIATDDVTALLVNLNDHEAMAQRALALLTDPALVKRLTSAAYASCERFSEPTVSRAWADYYHRMLSSCES